MPVQKSELMIVLVGLFQQGFDVPHLSFDKTVSRRLGEDVI